MWKWNNYYIFFFYIKLCIGWKINVEISCNFFYKNIIYWFYIKVLRKKIYYFVFYIIFLILEFIKYVFRVVNLC